MDLSKEQIDEKFLDWKKKQQNYTDVSFDWPKGKEIPRDKYSRLFGFPNETELGWGHLDLQEFSFCLKALLEPEL